MTYADPAGWTGDVLLPIPAPPPSQLVSWFTIPTDRGPPMFRMALVACIALVSVAPAAPVPKSLKAKPIRMTAPRPLMIRTAVVEGEEVKLTRDENDREPQTAPLRDVTVTDPLGKQLSEATLKKRLAKPMAVIVVPCPLPKRLMTAAGEEDTEPADVDTGDEWRRVLAADAIIIDGEAFGLDWELTSPDLQIVPAATDADEDVVISSLGLLLRHSRREVHENCIPKNKDRKAATEFNNKVQMWGVAVFHKEAELQKEHRRLFGDDPPFAHDPGGWHFKGGRIQGGIL